MATETNCPLLSLWSIGNNHVCSCRWVSYATASLLVSKKHHLIATSESCPCLSCAQVKHSSRTHCCTAWGCSHHRGGEHEETGEERWGAAAWKTILGHPFSCYEFPRNRALCPSLQQSLKAVYVPSRMLSLRSFSCLWVCSLTLFSHQMILTPLICQLTCINAPPKLF